MEQLIDFTQRLTGIISADRRAFQQGAAGHHEERGRHTLVGDVRDGEANTVVLQPDDVIKIAPDITGRLHVAENMIVGVPGKHLRENGLLRAVRHLKLVFNRDELISCCGRLSPLLQVLERPFNRDVKVIEVHRLGDEVEGSAVHCRADVLHVAVRGYHDAAEIVAGDIRYFLKERETVHLRHTYVRDNHVYVLMLLQHFKGLKAVLGEFEVVHARTDLAPHAQLYKRLQIRLIVDDENPVRLLHLCSFRFQRLTIEPFCVAPTIFTSYTEIAPKKYARYHVLIEASNHLCTGQELR